jgi:hypothetical protein
MLLPLLAQPAHSRGADQQLNITIDWPAFLARQDPLWTKLPDKWGSGAFLGNGLLGANVFTTDDHNALRWRIGRTDVTYLGNRIPIGELVLHPVGQLQGCDLRLDLWNAELTGSITTSAGKIGVRSFTHSSDIVQIIELTPDAGEAACHFEWEPGLAVDPRKVNRKEEVPERERNPKPTLEDLGKVHICTQPLNGAGEHATAWTDIPETGGGSMRLIVLSVGFSKTTGAGKQEAIDAVNKATTTGLVKLTSTHRHWWHAYWPESFISIPDGRLESFYWMQMYKLASATRADRPAIDLMGPWTNNTPWAKIWWNLNIQLTYWPVLASNRLELGESLCRMLDAGAPNLAANAKEFSTDSATIGRSASYDCVRSAGNELCDLPWVMHNYWLQYRYTMDDAMLRERLFPLLKRSINYYFHNMKLDDDGFYHITRGYSPEYPDQPDPNPDCNIDLSLVRWGCQTLLAICDRLKIDDPLIPKWKETLQKLRPYPTDKNGLMISASVPFAQSHRHYSHLLMIYPLYIMNTDQPENAALVTKSLDHWMGMPQALKGYSYTGAASISALMGRGDDALKYLNGLLDKWVLPNTLYTESGPCIETPLSAAASLHDMLLSSWGGKIRVFPAIPSKWRDVTIHNMRTEGAFLVSAVRRDGKTRWVRITSLAGEPCRLVTDIATPAASIPIKLVAEHEYEFDLKKGQTVLVMEPVNGKLDLTVAPVAAEQGRINYYGLH